MSRGEVMSFWIPIELRERLDRYRESYTDKSRSRYICSAIEDFLSDPKRKYLIEKGEPKY
jgi:predicted DNA-binding protein